MKILTSFLKRLTSSTAKHKVDDGWIDVNDRLPSEPGIYSVKRKYGDEITETQFTGLTFLNYHGYAVTHWLDKKKTYDTDRTHSNPSTGTDQSTLRRQL